MPSSQIIDYNIRSNRLYYIDFFKELEDSDYISAWGFPGKRSWLDSMERFLAGLYGDYQMSEWFSLTTHHGNSACPYDVLPYRKSSWRITF